MILIMNDPVIDTLVDKFGEKRFLDYLDIVHCEKNQDIGPKCRNGLAIDLAIVNCKWAVACEVPDNANPFCLPLVAHAIQELLETL